MGNGAKAAAAREKNASKKTGPTSQIKSNASAMSIQCVTCKQPFMITVKTPALTEHAENKHKKTIVDCFPGFVERTK